MNQLFKKNYIHQVFGISIASLGIFIPSYAAVSVSDTLTGASSTYNWQSMNGACLTAGDGTGSIPACSGLPYYSGKALVGGINGRLPDPVGQGALRLTNGAPDSGVNGNNQTGAVYAKDTFPSNAGIDITFKTVTYGGNGYNNGSINSGADGISFFLADADQVTKVDASTKIGSFGGSLGYSCANGKPDGSDGLYGAYIGLGIDEFGNFSNSGDNTNTGPGFSWNRVTLRGAGNINWKWLSENKAEYYPSGILDTFALQNEAVMQTCKTGKLYKYTKNNITKVVEKTVVLDTGSNYRGFYNYPYIAHNDIMDTKLDSNEEDNARKKRKPIFNQQQTAQPKRGSATPITYNVKITQDGLLSFSYSYNGGVSVQVLDKQNITASNGPLPKNFRFGFSGGTGGGSNVHEIMCFKADQITGSASSSAGNVPPLGRVIAGSQLYIASYHVQNWWGQLMAQSLVEDTTTGAVTLSSKANWDASCKLTGGSCTGTGVTTTAQTSRKLFTWNGSGKTLEWANLSTTQKSALGSNTALAQSALNWLKGTRTEERTSAGAGALRARDSLLGDIVNSSPTWVGAPSSPYTGTWSDLRYSSTTMPEGSTSYAAFASTQKARTHAVYVGANDGYLHAFRAGKSKADGTLDTTTNDGEELFAYMPDQVLRTVANTSNDNLSLPATSYGYNAFVDATPGIGDLFYGGAWRTWAVGGLGLGGNKGGVIADDTSISKGAIFALDVTDPSTFNASKVVGEWNSDNISCVETNCNASLGSTVGTPLVRRLHDGNWAVIFPNGQNSSTGEAGIYVMTVAQSDGARTFRYIKAADPQKSGTTITKRNGISQVTAVDLDGDHVTDYVYGGDMLGNIWRFDLTSNDSKKWVAGSYPVFKVDSPITTSISASSTTKGGIYRVILNFGTGRLYPKTLNFASSFASGDHYLYGIWDADMAAWNAKSNFPYQSLTLSGSAITVGVSELLTRTITDSSYVNAALGINGARSVSTEALCWKGSSICKPDSSNNKRGWRMKLPQANEQIFYNPILQDGFVTFNTTVPEVTQGMTCDVQAAKGFTMALPPDTGVPEKSYFITPGWTGGVLAGVGTSGVGSIIVVRSGSRTFGTTQTASGQPKTFELDPSANAKYQRITWIKRR